MRAACVAVAALAAGCGDDLPSTVTVTVSKAGNTGMVEVWLRGDSGAWFEPFGVDDDGARAIYSIEVRDGYSVWIACNDRFGRQFTHLVNATPGERPSVAHRCDWSPPAEGPYRVTGKMLAPGWIFVGDVSDAKVSAGAYTLAPTSTPVDIAARGFVNPDADTRLVLYRDVPLAEASRVVPIDVMTEGVALERMPVTVDAPADGLVVRVTSQLVVAGRTPVPLIDATNGLDVLVPPAGLLEARDRLWIGAEVVDSTTTRATRTSAFMAGQPLPLLPALRLEDVIEPPREERWVPVLTLPGVTPTLIAARREDAAMRSTVEATAGWLAWRGLAEVHFDSPPELAFHVAGSDVRAVRVHVDTDTLEQSTELRWPFHDGGGDDEPPF